MRARSVEGLEPTASLRRNAGALVATRLAELRELAEPALVADASRTQHDMRIAAKRLRYLLELFEPCLGEPADDGRRLAKSLQGVLGDLHDCDVLAPRAAGIPSLQAVIAERRARLFGRFVELWRSPRSAETWDRLERAL